MANIGFIKSRVKFVVPMELVLISEVLQYFTFLRIMYKTIYHEYFGSSKFINMMVCTVFLVISCADLLGFVW